MQWGESRIVSIYLYIHIYIHDYTCIATNIRINIYIYYNNYGQIISSHGAEMLGHFVRLFFTAF